MVEIDVPVEVRKNWKKVLVSYQNVLGYELVLCTTVKHNVYQPIVYSSESIDYVKYTLEVDAFSKLVLSHNAIYSKPCLVDGFNYSVGIPITWSSMSHFGVLLAFSKDKPIQVEHYDLLKGIVSQIEQDLVNTYRDNQREFRVDLTSIVDHRSTPEFQSFIDSFSDHLWVKNLDGVYTHCNREVSKAWGKPVSEIIGKTDLELFDPEIAEKFEIADNEVVVAGKQTVVEECANAVNPQSKTWLETIKAPMLDDQGQTIGIIGMTRNVTNRKAIEDQLLVAATVFENSIEGVIISNRDGMIIYVNKAFCEITGYQELEAIGRNPRFLKSGRHEKSFYREIWKDLFNQGQWKGEIWNRRKNGEIFPELSTISVVYDDKRNICNYVAVFSDISQQKQQENDLQHMAYHDPLTDLPNRTKLTNQIKQEIYHAKRNQELFATIFIDIDHFKHVNDSYGHLVGDEVLCEIASRLKGILREVDTVSRIGGDEFVLLLPAIADLESISIIAPKIMSIFDKPIGLDKTDSIRLTGSMGIALYPQDGEDSDLLLSNSDAAMYRAKKTGRNNYAYYTEALTKQSESHLKLQAALHDALDHELFFLVYQPQVDMITGRLIGFESLLRWNDPKLGSVSPDEFIPIAEKTGLIQEIGLRVVKEACKQAIEWRDKGFKFGRIAVNVAGAQLQRSNFAELVISVLKEADLEAKYLELEVTEGFMMSNAENAVKQLETLRAHGIELSMDDFGTGYSSLSYLQKLPLNTLKIDRSFVMNLPENKHDVAITDAIIALGNAMSLNVIAEGVETLEQADFLVQRGCRYAQGYYFSRPLPAKELIPLLEQKNA
ncbi:sensor domain-containing protein [Vibrio sp. VB16]|uniref:sensor domain-containing protein n=1 Tax=Vibrio sp. VB16 TaxID=2785746 RepID=UPI00189E45C6|nr:bifunctional diguanylate cyclase/phosphodiesterase [Vibrio sp. VB16]UGA56700.1 EAL domain-containing protein [Vibrio sp. VB16]